MVVVGPVGQWASGPSKGRDLGRFSGRLATVPRQTRQFMRKDVQDEFVKQQAPALPNGPGMD